MEKNKIELEKIPWQLVEYTCFTRSGGLFTTDLENLIEFYKTGEDFGKDIGTNEFFELVIFGSATKKEENLIYIGKYIVKSISSRGVVHNYPYYIAVRNNDMTIKKAYFKQRGQKVVDIKGKDIEKIDDIIYFKSIEEGYEYFSKKTGRGEYKKSCYWENLVKKIVLNYTLKQMYF